MTLAMYEGIDTAVLYEELAYEDVLPLTWRRLPEPFDPVVLGSYAERNMRVLQALSAIEEHGHLDKTDENLPHAADLIRLDTKVNLLLDMVGRLLVASQPRPRPVPVRFNALGAVWQAPAPLPELGNQGVIEIYLRDCIADPLRLIGRIAAVSPDGRIKARIVPPGDSVADLIEKMAFRRHRRQIAVSKQPKK